jgi:hypothetical protein
LIAFHAAFACANVPSPSSGSRVSPFIRIG